MLCGEQAPRIHVQAGNASPRAARLRRVNRFREKVQRSERELNDEEARAAIDRERADAERLRSNAIGAAAFAELLDEVSQTLRTRGARSTKQRVKVPRYGVVKTKMGSSDYRAQTFKGWALELVPHRRRLWIEVGGGHWTDGYGASGAFDFARVRRAKDPAPVHTCYRTGSRTYEAVALSVLPPDVTWTDEAGFRLVYTHYAGRDGPAIYVDVDFEEVLARAVAAMS